MASHLPPKEYRSVSIDREKIVKDWLGALDEFQGCYHQLLVQIAACKGQVQCPGSQLAQLRQAMLLELTHLTQDVSLLFNPDQLIKHTVILQKLSRLTRAKIWLSNTPAS